MLVLTICLLFFVGPSKQEAAGNYILEIAKRLANRTMTSMMNTSEYVNMGNWSYEGAIIVRGLWEMESIFESLDLEPFLHRHLNYFQNEPTEFGYKILNKIPFNLTFRTIGDEVGLFPIGFADRLRYAKDDKAYSAENDTLIIKETVTKFIEGFPYHLIDGTISRYFWSGGINDTKGEFVWIDDEYMGTALANDLSRITNDRKFVLEAVTQHFLFEKHLRSKDDGLYFHGFNNLTAVNSCCKWGRGNGWSLMGKTDTLLTLADLGLNSSSNFSSLLQMYQNHCLALKNVQASNGGWHNVVTSNGAFIETSGTAMYLYSVLKGVEYGWLDKKSYSEFIKNAWNYLTEAILEDGSVRDIIRGTGVLLVEEDYDRSRDYKLSGPGLGSVLRAVAAYSKFEGQPKSASSGITSSKSFIFAMSVLSLFKNIFI